MFTGLVEETGKVLSLEEGEGSWALTLEASVIIPGLALGDSVACNGCCLTVTKIEGNVVAFDVLEETLRLTSLDEKSVDSLINLERSLPANGRLGGHFVTGHVDTTGQVKAFEPRGKDHFLCIEFPEAFARYVVYKGCMTIDGISLTVAEVEGNTFSVWLIPHTIEVTHLQELQVGKKVNLEFDLLAKYVEKISATKD